jgi:hypothetical protein
MFRLSLSSIPSPGDVVSLFAGVVLIAGALFVPGFRRVIENALNECDRLRAHS